MSSSFGKMLTLTTFGESHGAALGGVVDGFPSGIAIDEDFIRQFDLVGISAGSSTPDSVINKVVRRLEEL